MRKTESILQILRQEFRQGHYVTGRRFASEQQLMNRFHVARTTINKITEQLAHEGFIIRGGRGSGTRVLNPNPFPLGNIAFICPVHHPYFAHILEGAQRAAYSQGYSLSVFSPQYELLNDTLDKIEHGSYVGLLAAGIGFLHADFPMPVVYVDNSPPSDDFPHTTVSCSDWKASHDMCEAVLSRGHREVVVMSSCNPIEYGRKKRMEGFQACLEEAGFPDASKRLFWNECGNDDFSLRSALQRVLAEFPGITVIMTDSDDIACGLYHVLSAMRREHPVSLTGFGHVYGISKALRFASVEQHPEEIGKQSVLELLALIRDPEGYMPHEVSIEAELVNLDQIPTI